MGTTNIPYLDRVWNPSGWGCNTGCSYCYARRMAHRGMMKCPLCNDFVPHEHPERLVEPLKVKQPTVYGEGFMSDDWAPWVDPVWQRAILKAMRECPQHFFVCLTKHPEMLANHNPWPSNAWVGVTITGAEPPERQMAMIRALREVKGAGGLWLSFEPMLGKLHVSLEGINWLAMGAQTGKGAKRPELAWVQATYKEARHVGAAVWQKSNLVRRGDAPADLIQKRPASWPKRRPNA